MSVILEFTIDGDAFQLGQVLSGPPTMHLELERIVPTGDMVMPFVWAEGDDHEAFAEKVRNHPMVRELAVLDRIEDSTLYRVEWEDEPTDLIEGIARSDATVLEARGQRNWLFRLRFTDHDRLSAFHNHVIQRGIDVHIKRTYTLTEETEHGHRFDLTPEQREALILALRQGYFESPSRVSLAELAGDLGITKQALSSRIRGGNEKILRKVLLPSVEDRE